MTDIIHELRGNAFPAGQAYINLCERAADEIEKLRGEVSRLIALAEEAVSLVKEVKAERDAAFRMSKCECAADECCANLARLHAERDAAVKLLTAICNDEQCAHWHEDIDALKEKKK